MAGFRRTSAVGANPSPGYRTAEDSLDDGAELQDDAPQFAADISTDFRPGQMSNPAVRERFEGTIRAQERSDEVAAHQAAVQQRRNDVAQNKARRDQERAQRDQERAQKEQADFQKREVNKQREAAYRTKGVKHYTDADGMIQPDRDEKGRTVYNEDTSETQYDAAGKAFQTKRDQTGQVTKKVLDEGAEIGENKDDPNDKFIYRKNKHQEWEAIDPEEGLKSDDMRVRTAAAKALHEREVKDLDRQKSEIAIKLKDPSAPKPLKDKDRGILEQTIAAQSVEIPKPQPKGAWHGLGAVAIDPTELASWQEQETQRVATLTAAQDQLAKDDEHKGLRQKDWELEKTLMERKKGGAAGLLQRRLTEEADAVKARGEMGVVEEIGKRERGFEGSKADLQQLQGTLTQEIEGHKQAMQSVQAENAALLQRGARADDIVNVNGQAWHKSALQKMQALNAEGEAKRATWEMQREDIQKRHGELKVKAQDLNAFGKALGSDEATPEEKPAAKDDGHAVYFKPSAVREGVGESLKQVTAAREGMAAEVQPKLKAVMDRVRSGALDAKGGEAEKAKVLESVKESFATQQASVGLALQDAMGRYGEGKISKQELNKVFETAGSEVSGEEAFKGQEENFRKQQDLRDKVGELYTGVEGHWSGAFSHEFENKPQQIRVLIKRSGLPEDVAWDVARQAGMDKADQQIRDAGAAWDEMNLEEKTAFAGSVFKVANVAPLLEIAVALDNNPDTVSQQEIKSLRDWAAKASRNSTVWANVLDIVSEVPAFGVELAATGSASYWGRKSAEKVALAGIMKYAGKEGLAKLEKFLAKKGAVSYAANLTGKIAKGVAGEVARLPVASLSRITEKTIQNMIPEYSFKENEAGKLAAAITEGGEGDGLGKAIGKATLDLLIENVSEQSGKLFGKLGGDLLKKAGPLKEKAMKLSFVKAIMKLNPGKPVGKLAAVLEKSGWNGVFSEMLEERTGEAMRWATGLEDWKAPTMEQFGTELLAFSIPGAAIGAVNKGLKMRGERQLARQEQAARDGFQTFTANFTPENLATEFNRQSVAGEAGDVAMPDVSPEQAQSVIEIAGVPAEMPAVKEIERMQADLTELLSTEDADAKIAIRSQIAALEGQKQQAALGTAGEVLESVREISEIEQQAAEQADPAQAQLLMVQAAKARGVAKIANGRPLETLTADELTAVGLQVKGGSFAPLSQPKDIAGGKAVAGAVQLDVAGNPVITDGAILELQDSMPATAALVRGNETQTRERFAKAAKAAETDLETATDGKDRAIPNATKDATPGADDATPPSAAADVDGGTWTATGENGTAVKVQAKTKAEAERKLAGQLPAGELLQVDSVTGEQSAKPTTQSAKEGAKAEKKLGHGEKLRSVVAKGKPNAKVQKLTDALAPQLDTYGDMFPGGIEYTSLPKNDAGIQYSPAEGKLQIDLGRLAGQISGAKDAASLMQATIREELVHRAATDVLSSDEVTGLWDKLPESIKQSVRESYHNAYVAKGRELPEDNAYQLGHEFLRMLVQDKFWNQVTESMDIPAGLMEYLRELLSKIGKKLRQLVETADAGLKKDVQAAEKAIAKRLKDLGAVEDEAVDVKAEQSNSVVAQNEPERFATTGDTGTAYTDANEPIEYQWAVAEMDSLVVSNEDNGGINPDYPQELQPRDRSTAGSQAQVNDIAKNSNFDRLSVSDSVGNGAPIVGKDDSVVESGNGRVMGLRRAYTRGLDSVEGYKQKLIEAAGKFGLNAKTIQGMKNPVLVRVRQTEVDRRKFAEVANVTNVAPMREMEVAKKDAANLSPALLSAFAPGEDGEILTAENFEFIRGFVRDVIPKTERAAIVDSRGMLSQTGLRRVRNALFVYAYGGSDEALNALGRLTEDVDADGKNITSALVAAAPVFAAQNAEMKAGNLHDLSLTNDLIAAVQVLNDVRTRGEKVEDYLKQGQLIDDGITPLQKDLLRFLSENGRSSRRIFEALKRYSTAVENAGSLKQASLFGDDVPPTKAEALKVALSGVLSAARRTVNSVAGAKVRVDGVTESGAEMTVEMDAVEAVDDTNKRLAIYRKLLDCVKGARK